MTEDFYVFQKFTDVDIANEFGEELKKNGIEYFIEHNNKSSVGNFEINTIDFDVAINLRSEDFPKADKVLEDYYKKEAENVANDHYLFEFSDKELHEIISNPFDWGHFDYQLAKKILKDRGEEITEDSIKKIKDDTLLKLSKIEPVSEFKLICGYILSIVFPLGGFIIGYNIINNKKILPNGQVFFLHSDRDRKHGTRILTISIMWFFILLILQILLLSTKKYFY